MSEKFGPPTKTPGRTAGLFVINSARTSDVAPAHGDEENRVV